MLDLIRKVAKVDTQTACQLSFSRILTLKQVTTGEARALSGTGRHLGLLEAAGSSERRAEAMWWQLPVVVGTISDKMSQSDHFGGKPEK